MEPSLTYNDDPSRVNITSLFKIPIGPYYNIRYDKLSPYKRQKVVH